jgi:ribonuclease T2
MRNCLPPKKFTWRELQEWPGSFCDTAQGCVWPNETPAFGWLLHGLWPEFDNGTWPQYCHKEIPFNATAIEDLKGDLDSYWPSLMSKDFDAFWAHEWTRHGTCALKLTPGEHDYFSLVLHLREAFDAFSILNRAVSANQEAFPREWVRLPHQFRRW